MSRRAQGLGARLVAGVIAWVIDVPTFGAVAGLLALAAGVSGLRLGQQLSEQSAVQRLVEDELRAVRSEAEDTEQRLRLLVRRLTGRDPDDGERSVLRGTLDAFRDRYRAAPADAEALLGHGEAPLPDKYDAAELASWTMTANTVLSLDAAIVRS